VQKKEKMGSPKRRRDSRTPPPPGDDRHGRSRSRDRARLDSKGSGGRRDDPADLDWNKSTQQFLRNLSSAASGSSGWGSGRSSRQDGGYGRQGYGGQSSYDRQTHNNQAGQRHQSSSSYQSGSGSRDTQHFGMPVSSPAYNSTGNMPPHQSGSVEGSTKSGKTKDKDEDSSSSSSSGSDKDDESDQPKIDPVKVRRQHATYVEAKVKLEGQLLKLKEQREVLKDAGQKHEDQDMRENAKLQKEVKTRITYVVEALGKMDEVLKREAELDEERKRRAARKAEESVAALTGQSPSSSTLSRRVTRVRSESRGREEAASVSTNSAAPLPATALPPAEKASQPVKKTKKKRPRKESSSGEGSEEEEKPKLKAKKKQKKKAAAKKKKSKKSKQAQPSSSGSTSSSSSEDSDAEPSKKKSSTPAVPTPAPAAPAPAATDSLATMMMAMAGGGGGGGGGGGDSMMELLGKMSEAYMTAKKENNDLRARVTAAESENAELKKKMAKLHKKIDKLKASQDQDPTVAELTADSVVAAATKAVQSLESKDTTKSVRARIREEELRAAEEKARKAAEESKRAADEAAAAAAAAKANNGLKEPSGPPAAYDDSRASSPSGSLGKYGRSKWDNDRSPSSSKERDRSNKRSRSPSGYKRNVRQASASPALAGSTNPYGSRSPEARRGRSRTRSGSRSPARRGSDSRSPGRRGSRSRSPDGRDRQRPYYHPRPNYNNRGGYNNYRGGYNNYNNRGYNKYHHNHHHHHNRGGNRGGVTYYYGSNNQRVYDSRDRRDSHRSRSRSRDRGRSRSRSYDRRSRSRSYSPKERQEQTRNTELKTQSTAAAAGSDQPAATNTNSTSSAANE